MEFIEIVRFLLIFGLLWLMGFLLKLSEARGKERGKKESYRETATPAASQTAAAGQSEKQPQSLKTDQQKVQVPVQQIPAEKEEETYSGECGDEMGWRQLGDTLYIEGEGVLEAYAIHYDSSIRKVVIASGCTEIADGAFFDCENLQTVELPEGLLRIGEEAFLYCENLQEINLPEGLQEIGAHAFSSCKNLELQIPDSVTEIGEDAYAYVPEIDYFGPAWDEWNWGANKWVNIHDTCDSGSWKIKDNTLYVYVNGKLSLKGFEVGSGYYGYTETVFRSPWYLEEERLEHVFIAPGCTKIGNSSFILNSRLKTISIPDTVKEIGECAFQFCRKLRSVVLPEGLTKIGRFTFHDCESLASVTIPGTVTEIGQYAFSGCKCLASIEIPDSVTEIGEKAFLDVPHILYNGHAQSDDNWGALGRN